MTTEPCEPMRHPLGPKWSPSRVTKRRSGSWRAAATPSAQPSTTSTRARRRSSRRATAGSAARTWARMPSAGRNVGLDGGSTSTAPEASAACERGERTVAGLGVGDEHGGERIAGGGLEGGLPALVDLDLVDQRAEHAGHLGEALRPGSVAGLVERERQRLGPGRPRVLVGLGAATDLLGPRAPGLGGRQTRGGAAPGPRPRPARRPPARPPRPRRRSASPASRGGLRLDRGQAGGDALHLGGAPLDAGLQRARAHRAPRRPGRASRSAARLAPGVVEAGPLVLDLGLEGGDAVELGRDLRGLGVDLGQLAGPARPPRTRGWR